jgi:hypothetical protein
VSAAVVFHPVKDGEDEGRLEMKTDPDGKAVIDVIPTGSSVRIQVIADGFATFAEDYVVSEASRKILITMVRPRAQVSAYVDNNGKELLAEPGAQVPVRPKLDSSGRPIVTPAPSHGAGSGSGSDSGSAGTSGSTTSGSKPQ